VDATNGAPPEFKFSDEQINQVHAQMADFAQNAFQSQFNNFAGAMFSTVLRGQQYAANTAAQRSMAAIEFRGCKAMKYGIVLCGEKCVRDKKTGQISNFCRDHKYSQAAKEEKASLREELKEEREKRKALEQQLEQQHVEPRRRRNSPTGNHPPSFDLVGSNQVKQRQDTQRREEVKSARTQSAPGSPDQQLNRKQKVPTVFSLPSSPEKVKEKSQSVAEGASAMDVDQPPVGDKPITPRDYDEVDALLQNIAAEGKTTNTGQ